MARNLNTGFLEEFETWRQAAKSLLMPHVRRLALPWAIIDTGFGADLVAQDGTVIASCPDGESALNLLQMARQLESELAG
jgi:hypothetical protein